VPRRNMSGDMRSGIKKSIFKYLKRPCLAGIPHNNGGDLQAASKQKCSVPTQHLFW
jgi:hypothetical protein